MPDCANPVTDTGRKNSVPWADPAQACPVGIPDNTATVSWVNGEPVFSLGVGIGTVPGGGDNCPPVPPPAVSFITGAENIGTGEGLFGQLVGGILQFLSLNFGSGFQVTNEGTSLLIELIDSGVISWDDVLSKPAEFPPSAHTHTLANITDAGSAAGADSADFEPARTAASQAEMETGTEAALRSMSPLRVAQAIASLAAGAGTVTNTGGALTANAVVLGAGSADAKVVAGVTTNGTAQLVLGVNTTTLGSVKLFGNTSGDVTLAPNAVAGTAIALTLPATSGTVALTSGVGTTTPVCIQVACSDETTALTTGTAKATFRSPYAFTLTGVRASVTTAPTGATLLQVDINESGTTVLSTELTFDASEKTTVTAATPAVISDSAIADDAEITIDIVAVGSTIAGAGLKVTLLGSKP